MPRLSNRPPKLRKHASGQAFVTVSGKSLYLGRWNSTEAKAAYRKFCREWKPKPRDVSIPDAERLTVVELLAKFVEHCDGKYQKNGKPTSTVATFKTPLRVLRDLFADLRVVEFGPLRLERARAEFLRRGASRSVANRYARLTVKVFRWGVSRELVDPSIPAKLETLEPLRAGDQGTRENEPVGPVDDATIAATLPHLPPVVADMVRFARLTGCRPNEVSAVRPCDIDRGGAVWLFRPTGHKLEHLGKARIIAIGPKAQDILRPYLLRPADAYCFSPAETVDDMRERRTSNRKTPDGQGNGIGSNRRRKPAILPGGRYDAAAFRRAITRACEIAFNMPKDLRKIPADAGDASERRERASQWRAANCWAPNQLRHTFATELRRAGGLEAAQVALGHTQRATTEVYAETDLTAAVEIVAKIG